MIVKLAVGAACAALGLLVELGLDQVVVVAPWLIVAFVAGALAAILGGVGGGLVAAVIGMASQRILIPAWVADAGRLDGMFWQIDVAVVFAALLAGIWIRTLILRPEDRRRRRAPHQALTDPSGVDRIAERAAGPAGPWLGPSNSGQRLAPGTGRALLTAPASSADRRAITGDGQSGVVVRQEDRNLYRSTAAGNVLAAVRDIGSARTPVQVADALARHGAAFAGATGAVVYLRRTGTDEFVVRGRAGSGDPTAPERITAGPPSDLGRRSGPARPTPRDDAGRPFGPGVVELPFGRGPSAAGIIRFAGLTGMAGTPHFPTQTPVGPTIRVEEPPLAARLDPIVELLALVTADAVERAELLAARSAADGLATTAAGSVSTLARLAAELVRATTVEEVARSLIDLAVDDLAAGFAVVHVPDPGTGRFQLVRARGYPAGLLAADATTEPDADGPVTRAATERAMVEVSGEDGWRTAFPATSNVPAITGARMVTALPMQAAGSVQGVWVIGWRVATDRLAADNALLATAADQAAQALERAILHAQEEDARRLQEAFIAVVSHELRTPITTILGGSRLLRRRLDDDPRSAELSEDIVAEADRLSRIVDDLLVLSRLERRHLTLGDEPVHLDHLLARVVRSEAERWPAHRFELPPLGSHVVRGDDTYIEQVLRNLVSNAAKYSPEGSLVRIAIDESTEGEVFVRVLDRGTGVAPAEVDDLFSLFYRSATTAASAAGAGIGLFVSRRLVAEMGGRMWAEPRPDGGSEFGFSLRSYPIDEADAADEADEADVARDADNADEHLVGGRDGAAGPRRAAGASVRTASRSPREPVVVARAGQRDPGDNVSQHHREMT